MNHWLPWVGEKPVYVPGHTFEDALHIAFQNAALKQGVCAFRTGWIGALMTPEMHEKLHGALGKRGGKLVGASGAAYELWALPEGVVSFSNDDTGTCWDVISFSLDVIAEIRTLGGKPSGEDGAPTVRVLEFEDGSYYFNELKVPTSPLIRSNYSMQIAAEYDVILAGLTAPTPPGRLTILSGEPGTGKSHFVRGLLEDARKQAMFCLVPPHMLTDLSGPNLIGALRSLREPMRRRRRRRDGNDIEEGSGDKTIVLVLEDADSCLVPRASDNMPLIATILNMSDGIFGAALDIRILATTNAKSFEIDAALERPGRLLMHAMFARLSMSETNGILERLGSSTRITRGPFPTLAEVYAMARKANK